jgi:23S rRNA (pseudouridine1915-N3)-methyltransferase
VIRHATIVAVGRLRGWAAKGCDDYLDRLRRYFPVEVVEVPEEDMNRRSPEEVLAAEGERLLKRLPAGAHVVALDREKGKHLSSEELSRELSAVGVSGRSHVAFVLGGPQGLSPEVLGRADERLSFGPITLPHALARVVLLEQLYRAVKIERGEKYHW